MAEGAGYERLAAAARDAGYSDVTPSRVHRWVRDQLLPSTGQRIPLGRRGFGTQPSEKAREQLLALCAMRSRTKRLDQLAVLLWVGGWEVSLSRIRRALRTYAPRPVSLPKVADRDEVEQELAEMALRIAPRIQAHFGWRGVGREELADAVFPMLMQIVGIRGQNGKRDALVIEDLTGLTRARQDTVGDVAPWLQSPPMDAPAVAAGLSFQAVDELIANVSDSGLELAARRLRFWLETAPKVAELAAAAGDPEFAGLHVFASIRPERAVDGLLLMLYFDGLGLSSTQDQMIAAFTEMLGPTR